MISGPVPLPQHSTYWFSDGTLLVHVENHAFKLHKALLHRHSRSLARWTVDPLPDQELAILQIPPGIIVSEMDFIILLEHLYHDKPLSIDTEFPRLASILRISSTSQLDLPAIHELSRQYMERMFPSGPRPFSHPPYAVEALALAREYGIESIKKGLWYTLVTTSDFDVNGSQEAVTTSGIPTPPISPLDCVPALSPVDSRRCHHLMTSIIDYFTPILFTPAVGRHMSCTDIFAESWMVLVIQPALENDAVYKPLESLHYISKLDWAARGICDPCLREKRHEWRAEQEHIWGRIDDWLTPEGSSSGSSSAP